MLCTVVLLGHVYSPDSFEPVAGGLLEVQEGSQGYVNAADCGVDSGGRSYHLHEPYVRSGLARLACTAVSAHSNFNALLR
jgi:hypothetical protein